MSLNSKFRFEPSWFKQRWDQTKTRAGRRYTPELNVSLPHERYFETLTWDVSFFKSLESSALNLKKVYFNSNLNDLASFAGFSAERVNSFGKNIVEIIRQLNALSDNRNHLKKYLPIPKAAKLVSKAKRILSLGVTVLREKMIHESRLQQKDGKVESVYRKFSELDDNIFEILEFLENPRCNVVNQPRFLLLGAAGTGKTHLLCDMAKVQLEKGNPALIFLGQEFQTQFTNPLEVLVKSTGLQIDPIVFFQKLNSYAKKLKTRCLIGIDAINEGHRESWKKAVPKLVKAIENLNGIGLVISCRTPFEKILFHKPDDLGFQTLYHYGYPPEEQLTAIEKYFTAHQIPLPEVPLLEEEFSNPLFLKLFCEAIEKVTIKKKHAQIKEISAGQKGMTHVLEYFVDEKDRRIAAQLGTRGGLSWKVLKDGIASTMASKRIGIIPLSEAKTIIDGYQPKDMASGNLLQAMVNEDILAEDVIFDGVSAVEGIRFSYQKFGDHLVARHLLSQSLDNRNSRSIRRSLNSAHHGLGTYFKDGQSVLRNSNIIQALLIEFPERIRNGGELLDYLKKQKISVDLARSFIQGLYWRDSRNINRSTGKWIGTLLDSSHLRNETFDLLLALGVKPKHPYSAQALDKNLSKFPLTKRDLIWTEYLRHNCDKGTADRILVWLEKVAQKEISSDFAEVYCLAVKWFLTSSNRSFRDRSTHALFLLGLRHPSILFKQTLKSLEVNDPYISERMLAASYGIAMALWRADNNGFAKDFQKFAKSLFRKMFAKSAPYGTTHILARDYAKRTIELASILNQELFSEEDYKYLNPPFQRGGIRDWGESDDINEGEYRDGNSPLGMDFRNYTLGRLVPNRGPYQVTPDYQKVERQILWRIYNLGYELKLFSEIDKEIARFSFRREYGGNETGKIDRYGKKYAWIAFYELAGYRQDKGLLEETSDERISDADIDPSFPELPKFSRIFKSSWIQNDGSVEDWMKFGSMPSIEEKLVCQKVDNLFGPWVVTEGFVNHLTEEKEIFTFLRGILVKATQIEDAKRILGTLCYPGNHAIPQGIEHYYSYAGEFPWASTWLVYHDKNYIRIDDSDRIEVFLPACSYNWENYHSAQNQIGTIIFPSKEFAESIRLYVQVPSTATAQTGSHKTSTIFINNGEGYKDHETILLIRQDLLDQYLKEKNLVLVIYAWGERRENYRNKDLGVLEKSGVSLEDRVHKQGFVYHQGKFVRFI